MDSPIISLIFVNYQSVFELSCALKALFSFEVEQELFEVIIVNNDATETKALESLARRIPFYLHTLPENVGFGKAANVGVAKARGKIVGFLNPDTVWQRPMLEELIRVFQESESQKVVGLRLIDVMGQREAFSQGAAPRLGLLLQDNLFFTRESSDLSVEWVSGAALFMERPFFRELGGFDEQFFLYFEDVDLCLRARKSGATILSDHHFSLVHQGGKSFASREAQKRFFYLSQQRYYEKHRPQWEQWLRSFFQAVFLKLPL